ncbi:hypothetical protein FGW37_03630 [Streptomyces rectiverticillatus]|uniref:hypothetical protein n=1 Tax=Streptomyces rectiverticillatus TaxID=173860 RepID=UPI0015C3E20E|nr:hypothetical protein [Streptomyces rectiverticillatus]QLE70818.1 hypothetical protein FGW37_03630 [Streptomyces rectiverticillatus]
MSSNFGDIVVGDYNVLPRDTTKTFYKAPPQVFLKAMPLTYTATMFGPLVLSWCRTFTKTQVENEYPLADAYATVAKESEGHWSRTSFDKDKVTVVHDDWTAWPVGMDQKAIETAKRLYGKDAQPS